MRMPLNNTRQENTQLVIKKHVEKTPKNKNTPKKHLKKHQKISPKKHLKKTPQKKKKKVRNIKTAQAI